MARRTNIDKYARSAAKNINYLVDTFCNGEQKVFCEKTGLSKGSVSQYCSGKNVPNNITAKKIADAFGVSPVWVMGFTELMKIEEIIRMVNDPKKLSADEEKVLKAYRNADSLTKAMVKRTLGMDIRAASPLAARPNANPNAGDSDSPENDIEKV